MTSPLVTVVVPTYNRPELLAGTLQSIAAQTLTDYEVLIVNDAGCSVEDTVAPFVKNGQFHLINHSHNQGLAAARNTAIRIAKGKYIAYLDDDDLFYPHHLEAMVGFLMREQAQIAYANAHRVIYRSIHGALHEQERITVCEPFDRLRMLRGNFLPVQAFVHDRVCYETCGYFNETLRRYEDWEFWLRLMERYKFHHVSEVTTAYRWVDNGTTMSSGDPRHFEEARALIYAIHGAKLGPVIRDLEQHVSLLQERVRYLEGYLAKFRSNRIYKLYARLKGIPLALPEAPP